MPGFRLRQARLPRSLSQDVKDRYIYMALTSGPNPEKIVVKFARKSCMNFVRARIIQQSCLPMKGCQGIGLVSLWSLSHQHVILWIRSSVKNADNNGLIK